jgi:ABC-2 type transport system ATP-binding protein
VIFSTHVIAHAERLCDSVAIIAGGKVPYAGSVDDARDRIPAQVRLETRNPTARGARRCRRSAPRRQLLALPACPTAASSRCCAR